MSDWIELNIGDPCYLVTRDAAWTIVKTAVDRVSAKGRFVNCNGWSYIFGKEVFASFEDARSAAEAERDRLVANAARFGLSQREVARLRALKWEAAQ